MPCRNEAHELGLTARIALRWCDELLIYVHASNDGTARIASELSCEFPDRVWVSFDPDPEWQEMFHRQHLLMGARQRGATHFAMVDADEVLTGNLLPTIRSHIERMPAGHILQLPFYYLRGSLTRYHANGLWGQRLGSVAFPEDPRAEWDGDHFHHREPFGVANFPYRPVAQGDGGILHLWGVEERRLRAKCALYKVTERLRWPWKVVSEIDRQYNSIYEMAMLWQFQETPAEWWAPYQDLMQYLDLSGVPWQEAEVKRLWKEHGHQRFAGLDLFGLV